MKGVYVESTGLYVRQMFRKPMFQMTLYYQLSNQEVDVLDVADFCIIEFPKPKHNRVCINSILQKKRFIELNELTSISEKFKISVNDIIGG